MTRWWTGGFTALGKSFPRGPAVVAANHLSHVDPVIVATVVGTPIRFLALDELYGRSLLFDVITLWLGAIPVSRDGVPLGAMKTSLAELDNGGVVGVFPEGARVSAWGERPAKRGAAWMARRARVPIVPVAIAGTDEVMGVEDRRLHRRPVAAVVGEPLFPGDFDGAADPQAEMMAEWVRRMDEAMEIARSSLV